MAVKIRKPQYKERGITWEDQSVVQLASELDLEKHSFGGYFRETDRSKDKVVKKQLQIESGDYKDVERSESSVIHFLMTCDSPVNRFHVNVTSKCIYVLQRGSGVYVCIHPDGRLETFRVGFDVANGERTQWVVEPGVYKAGYLVNSADAANETATDLLLITEIVVPGFDLDDMKFLDKKLLVEKVGSEQAAKLEFLL
ncbi:hypothetical protein JL09_g4768 [Pichia kudriavzevii]|uniref:DUF985 domain-containing protein n=1 Tax=Pichia kudriavzevii TaxID=4909 RepID=A0A099NVY6_PICKU|nr:hypothetical protein JL09_g4768 [Pichia kudriavzevii]